MDLLFLITLNESFIPICSMHVYEFRLSHLNKWAFTNDTGNCLNVFGKMNEANANEYITNLNVQLEISMLNGRYSVKLAANERDILKVYVQNTKDSKFGHLKKF